MSTGRPRWQKLAAGALALAAITLTVLFHGRVGADFWPLDASRVGPNLIADALTWAALFICAVLVYPPWRAAVHRFAESKLSGLHDRHDEHTEHLMHIGRSLADLHQKIDDLDQERT